MSDINSEFYTGSFTITQTTTVTVAVYDSSTGLWSAPVTATIPKTHQHPEAITVHHQHRHQQQLNLAPGDRQQVDNVLEIPVTASDADKITAALTVDVIKVMDENEFKFSVQAGDIA